MEGEISIQNNTQQDAVIQEPTKPERKRFGRPTKYSEEMIDKIYEYLETAQDKEVEVVKETTLPDGSVTLSTVKKMAVNLPSIEGFALFTGISRSTIYEWAKEYKDFSDTLEQIDIEQKKRVIEKGLTGEYNSTIGKLILSANHNMRDKADVTTDGKKITNKGTTFIVKSFKEEDQE